ncbi:MAG: MBOAT family protein [Hymenobacteraceae bacterium]|nr:MBOAT family protein [Hymenobacteraceae bacterium]
MLFNSFEFLIFFPVVTLGYFLLPHRHRWWWLLAASCVFYMFFKWIYILILFFTIIIDYYAGLYIERAHGRQRKWYLVMSLVANIGVLAIFKYYNFLNGNISGLASLFGTTNPIPALTILLPIGLSFHTFQAMSYTIEVYRGRQPAERHFGIYSLYVMFYPQLVAGPIERPQNVLHQFYEKHEFSYPRLISGLQLMAWGLFKKVVIADRLAVVVNQVYDNYPRYEGLPLIFATVLFSIQIYCDFSGYSDIALGSAEAMGFHLMKNFDRPYFSKSISEFWKRWHISLSTWFRDYLYISLGGNRVAVGRRYFNLWITFLISGLWHGASWNFILWGAIHGTYLIVGVWTKPLRRRFSDAIGITSDSWPDKILNVACTFVLAAFAWIFFRAGTFAQAAYIVTHLFSGLGAQLADWRSIPALLFSLGLPKTQLAIGFVAVLIMEGVHWLQRTGSGRALLAARPAWVRWPVYYGLLLWLLLFSYATANPEFIYFQF